jgi:hypothetical protein
MSTIHEMLIANRLLNPNIKTGKTTDGAGVAPKRRASGKTMRRHVYANGSTSIHEEERQQMIADNAYYRAERRNFEPGYELIDWLAAEAEIDRNLSQEILN